MRWKIWRLIHRAIPCLEQSGRATWELDRKEGAKRSCRCRGPNDFLDSPSPRYEDAGLMFWDSQSDTSLNLTETWTKLPTLPKYNGSDLCCGPGKNRERFNPGFIIQDFLPGIRNGSWWVVRARWLVQRPFAKLGVQKLCNDDLGVATRGNGYSSAVYRNLHCRKKVLLPLTPYLHAINYVGYCDVNCIISKESPSLWVHNALRMAAGEHSNGRPSGDPAQWMLDKIEGRDTLRVSDEIALRVVMVLPDFPYSSYTTRVLEGFRFTALPRRRRGISPCLP